MADNTRLANHHFPETFLQMEITMERVRIPRARIWISALGAFAVEVYLASQHPRVAGDRRSATILIAKSVARP